MKEWVDHLGNKFKSKKLMAEYWGKSTNILNSRLNLKLSLKDALERSVNSKISGINCYHMKFESLTKFAEYLRANLNIIFVRYSKGETAEEIHDKFVCNVDIAGKIFDRLVELSSYTGISIRTFLSGAKEGISYEEIVKNEKEIEITSKLTGLTRDLIINRIKEGKTHEDLLKIHCITYEYDGEIFKTLKDLSIRLKVNLKSLSKLVESIGLEKAIFLYSPIEYKEVVYKNHKEMVNSVGETIYSIYVGKIKRGVDYREALLRERADNKNTTILGVSLKRVMLAHGETFRSSSKYSKNYEEYVLNVLLWRNFNFLGFTEDNEVVYKENEESEILCTSFEEYIKYLEMS